MDWADIAGSELSSSDDETRNMSKANKKDGSESESETEQHVEHAAKADTNELIDAEDKIGTSESSNHNGVVLPSADAMLNSRINVPSFVNMAFSKQDITVLPKSSAEKNVPRKLRGTAQISSDTNVTHNASTSQTASSVSQASSILETSKKRIQESEEVLTFQQREKRKRDQGMASRGKNYVEEEKRILRQGGFD